MLFSLCLLQAAYYLQSYVLWCNNYHIRNGRIVVLRYEGEIIKSGGREPKKAVHHLLFI